MSLESDCGLQETYINKYGFNVNKEFKLSELNPERGGSTMTIVSNGLIFIFSQIFLM